MGDVRSYLGYDREYANREMVRDFVQANYYGGEMEIEEVIAGITEWFPEAREMYMAGEEIEMIIGAAMA